ncbi:hypothetical protein F949_00002 [Acinetobacter junii NIPH 182]|uniref:hypothetical protein n=1 Tax=Acinetobacter TaxID=469 RepID=UPI0002CEF9B0|nr:MULTISPECIES: hypothetical protein [Acinetobacter]ENV65103.1 hypothetical protein F949_00002 [Acinetobacter junii NIPH 182]MBV6768659.1 hypothetical protein [Acinetobacter baumannii]
MFNKILSYTAWHNGRHIESIYSYMEEPNKETIKRIKGLSTESMQAMLDLTVTKKDMLDYGYRSGIMHPMSQKRAKVLYGRKGIFKLFQDGTESLVEDESEIDSHDGLFGIESPDLCNLLIENECKTTCGQNVDSIKIKLAEWGYKDIMMHIEDEQVYFRRTLKAGQVEETEKTVFNDMLNVLPPQRHFNTSTYEIFMISEEIGGGIFQFYARVENRYFELKEHFKTDYDALERLVRRYIESNATAA